MTILPTWSPHLICMWTRPSNVEEEEAAAEVGTGSSCRVLEGRKEGAMGHMTSAAAAAAEWSLEDLALLERERDHMANTTETVVPPPPPPPSVRRRRRCDAHTVCVAPSA